MQDEPIRLVGSAPSGILRVSFHSRLSVAPPGPRDPAGGSAACQPAAQGRSQSAIPIPGILTGKRLASKLTSSSLLNGEAIVASAVLLEPDHISSWFSCGTPASRSRVTCHSFGTSAASTFNSIWHHSSATSPPAPFSSSSAENSFSSSTALDFDCLLPFCPQDL